MVPFQTRVILVQQFMLQRFRYYEADRLRAILRRARLSGTEKYQSVFVHFIIWSYPSTRPRIFTPIWVTSTTRYSFTLAIQPFSSFACFIRPIRICCITSSRNTLGRLRLHNPDLVIAAIFTIRSAFSGTINSPPRFNDTKSCISESEVTIVPVIRCKSELASLSALWFQ